MRRALFLLACPCVVVFQAVSCGGQTASLPPSDAGPGGDSSSSSGGGSSTSSSGASTSSTSSGGPVDASNLPFDGGPCPGVSLEQIYDAAVGAADVAGRWEACAGVENLHGFGNNPADTVGLEFASATSGGGGCVGAAPPCLGGDLYLLVQGASGLVRGQGPDYHIYYAFSGGEFWLFETPSNGSWSTAISASTNPRVLNIASTGYNSGTTLVGIP